MFATGVGSFLLYSVHEGIRGIPLDPSDKSDALVPVSGTSLAVGIDFHAGTSSFFFNIYPKGVKLIFTKGHISVMVALTGSHIMLISWNK